MGHASEVNFDGLVGPTHNYAGLSYGNVASKTHGGAESRPREAALQGLAKMKRVRDLGLRQAVLPPQARPDPDILRNLGFDGDDAAVLAAALKHAPVLLAAVSSASSMWTANAATVSPSADTADGRVHFTPANLQATLHRTLESSTTTRVLRAVFANSERFCVHDPLPGCDAMGDEGAANHTRLCSTYGDPGVELFVYGRSALDGSAPRPTKFPARQTKESVEAIARRHGLNLSRTVFAQQNPAAIDAGVFHNDVICVGNGRLLLFHEQAFIDTAAVLQPLRDAVEGFVAVEVGKDEMSFDDAVRSYLFNSQLVTVADGTMAFIAPIECGENENTRAIVDRVIADPNNPITAAHYLDVRQSMRNGGGPACLRLRVVLTDDEVSATTARVFLDDALYDRLTVWVTTHYRETLTASELADPSLLLESRTALDELTTILGLGSVYPYQRTGDTLP